MTDEHLSIEARYHEIEAIAQKVLACLKDEVDKLGFAPDAVELKQPDTACYRLAKDTANGQYSLIGDWIDSRGMRFGGLFFHADGSFFVEQDIVKAHPRKKQWFVEAVNAWGRDDTIKAEARLIPMPE